MNNTDNEKNLNPKPIDDVIDAGKLFAKPIDSRTDYGRGIVYKGWDGKEFASMKEVMQYNEMFYESQMIDSEKKGMRR